jgi:pimeloyl-ACP methyl ester carboxylesterase
MKYAPFNLLNREGMFFLKKTVFIVIAILFLWVLIAPGCMTFRLSDERAIRNFARKGLDLKPGYVNINQHQIHYVSVGNDTLPTLVLIHGSPSAWSAFTKYMEEPALLFHYRMIAVDRPGFGYSEFGNAMTLAEQSMQLIAVIKHLDNGKPVYLAGHSLGGPLVVKMAADAPQMFSGIMLISGSVDPSLEPKESWRYIMETFPLNHFLPGSFKPSNTELVHFKEEVKSLANDFPKVTTKVYLVHGDQDTWVPPGNVDYAKTHLTNATKVEIRMIPKGTHFIPWSHQKLIVEEMIKMAK